MSEALNYFKSHLAQTTPYPIGIEIERARGIYLYDKQGNAYMDMIAGIAVNNLGHSHPHIIKAVQQQAEKYMHVMVYGEYIQETQNKFAENLLKTLPEQLNCVYPVNSGTEANEAALKLAKRITGRTKLVAFKGAYHGSTHGSLSVSSNEQKKYAFRPLLPDVYFIRFNEPADLGQIDEKTAAVIIEPIQGDAGVRIPSKEFMQQLRQKCDETGALLIFDEIQCGMGRTGHLFAFEQFGVVPDILTIGKALGGGLPIGAMVTGREKMNSFTHDPVLGHITTFGGNPVCLAAANAFLEVMENEKVVEQVEEKGVYLESLLTHPAIREIRRAGLMFAIGFESADLVQKIVKKCLEKRVLTFWFLSCPDSFRLAPPLTISKEEMQQATKLINEVIGDSITTH